MITALIYILWAAFVYGIGVAIGFFYKPDQPTVLIGFVYGNLRCENDQGNSVYAEKWRFSFLFLTDPKILFPDEEKYFVTHLQYQARSWALLCWPMILHVCFWQPRFQQHRPLPNDPEVLGAVPGTELAFYGRLPGWRKQKPDPKPYILTKGYPPFGHLD